MNFWTLLFIPLLAPITVAILLNWYGKKIISKEQKMNLDNFVVYLPTSYTVFVFSVLFFLGMLITILALFEIIPFYAFIIGASIMVVIMLICLIAIRAKIVIKGEHITIYNGFSAKKEYLFNQISKAKSHRSSNGLESLKLYASKRLLTVSNIYVGYNLLKQKVIQEGLVID